MSFDGHLRTEPPSRSFDDSPITADKTLPPNIAFCSPLSTMYEDMAHDTVVGSATHDA